MKTLCKKLMFVVAFAAPALASATTTMSVSSAPWQMTITDLAPEDGIAAGLSTVTYRSRVAGTNYPNNPGTVISEVFTPVAQSVSGASIFGSVAASASGPVGAFQHSLATASQLATGEGDLPWWWTQVVQQHRFTLAPNTRFTVTGHITLTADVTYDSPGEDLTSWYGLNLGCGPKLWGDCGSVYVAFDAPGHYEREFAINFFVENTTEQTIAGDFYMSSTLEVQNPITPVPEPATVLMLAGGLPFALWASRRRKSRIA